MRPERVAGMLGSGFACLLLFTTVSAQVIQPEQGRSFQSFNPDISVIGDFLGHLTNRDAVPTTERFCIRESELGFSAYVDPYARADFFIHLHQHLHAAGGEVEREWHAGVCEGYLTLLNLPFDLQAKLGKFKAAFGKVNRMHTHSLPWVDRPEAAVSLLGEEGMSEQGVSVSWLVPNPWDKYLELTGEVFNNENPVSFAGAQGGGFVYLGHFKNFIDLSENSTLELGVSEAAGPNASSGDRWTYLHGADLTFKWRPLRRGLYKSLLWQSEVIVRDKELPGAETGRVWGAYSALSHQFAKRWSAGLRYDYVDAGSESGGPEPAGGRSAYSACLTFAQSEYCFWRIQYKHTEADQGGSVDEMWAQLNFGIGPHRAHVY